MWVVCVQPHKLLISYTAATSIMLFKRNKVQHAGDREASRQNQSQLADLSGTARGHKRRGNRENLNTWLIFISFCIRNSVKHEIRNVIFSANICASAGAVFWCDSSVTHCLVLYLFDAINLSCGSTSYLYHIMEYLVEVHLIVFLSQ